MVATAVATPPQLSPQQQEFVHRAAWRAGVLGTFNLLAKILSARLIALIAVLGGIILAYPALSHSDWYSIIILGVYCAGVVIPVVTLAALGR